MGIACQLAVSQGALPGAAAAYERKIRESGLDTLEAFAEGNYYPVGFKKEMRIRRRPRTP